jgi:capsular polysaccharide export protein
VVGQVEGDASIKYGAGEVRTNLGLLKAVRAAAPDAFIIWKPHPAVETGRRRGYLRPDLASQFADLVLSQGDVGSLFGQVDGLHTLTSQAGFEALLRGLPVTCWGRPFYAGWGLTEDRDVVARRQRLLSLDELVAACLILYPRYQDPITGLPCTPELLLERLGDAAAWPSPPLFWRGFLLLEKLFGQVNLGLRQIGLLAR